LTVERGIIVIAGASLSVIAILRADLVQKMSDGELFYHLKYRIRHTGMPAWTLPDRKLWQVTAYLRNRQQAAHNLTFVASGWQRTGFPI
jgi:hypothetical protein